MFNVIVTLGDTTEYIPCRNHREALDRKAFEEGRYPDAIVTVEPSH